VNGFKDYYLKLSYWQQYGLNNISRLDAPVLTQSSAGTDLITLWQEQSFERRNLHTITGERVYVKFPGKLNQRGIFQGAELLLGETGPRFIRTDIYPGSVPEIDTGYGIFLAARAIKKKLPNIILLSPRLPSTSTCQQTVETLDWRFLLRFVCLAGEARVIRRQRSLLTDRQEFIYQGVMRALGYGPNKENFSRLARTLPWAVLSPPLKNVPIELYPDFVRAVFFSAGGLFPKEFIDEETEKYVAGLRKLLEKYFPDCPQNIIEDWNLKNCRPVNYPWRRLAGFGYLLMRLVDFDLNWEKLLNHWIEYLTRAGSRDQFLSAGDFLVDWFCRPGEPADYFARRYRFGQKASARGWAFLGRNRASSVVLNVFLPAGLYLARQQNDKKLEETLWKFYYSLPVLEPNRRARAIWAKVLPEDLIEKNFLFNREVLNQGWLQIADDFCRLTSCEKCVLPTILRRKLLDVGFY